MTFVSNGCAVLSKGDTIGSKRTCRRGICVPYESSFKDQLIEELYEGILTLESVEDCNRFFEDICTIKELQSISQRLKVAKMLRENHTYTQIEQATGVSTATISRISKFLHFGPGGYNLVLDRLDKKKSIE